MWSRIRFAILFLVATAALSLTIMDWYGIGGKNAQLVCSAGQSFATVGRAGYLICASFGTLAKPRHVPHPIQWQWDVSYQTVQPWAVYDYDDFGFQHAHGFGWTSSHPSPQISGLTRYHGWFVPQSYALFLLAAIPAFRLLYLSWLGRPDTAAGVAAAAIAAFVSSLFLVVNLSQVTLIVLHWGQFIEPAIRRFEMLVLGVAVAIAILAARRARCWVGAGSNGFPVIRKPT